MSQNLRSTEEREVYDHYDNDAIFKPNATHANDPSWDNTVDSKPNKQNATHFQSMHWDNRVAAQHFKPNAKFINVRKKYFLLRFGFAHFSNSSNRCSIDPQTRCHKMNPNWFLNADANLSMDNPKIRWNMSD